jgi:hypothetical protein
MKCLNIQIDKPYIQSLRYYPQTFVNFYNEIDGSALVSSLTHIGTDIF